MYVDGRCVGGIADYRNQSAHLQTQSCPESLHVLLEAPAVDDLQAPATHLCAPLQVGQDIPPHLYRAVAEILAFLFRTQATLRNQVLAAQAAARSTSGMGK